MNTALDSLNRLMDQTTTLPAPHENLEKVVFNVTNNTIRLVSEEGHEAVIQCDNLMELHRLFGVSYSLSEGYDVKLEWIVS